MANTLTNSERLAINPEYLAGCIDCDGSISIVNMKRSARGVARRYELRLKITNTNREFLERIRENYGGYIKHSRHKNEKWKDLYDWEVQGAHAEKIILIVYQYLIIKKSRADVALELRDTFTAPRGKRVSDTIIVIREACFQKLKTLNMKGPTA